MYISLIHAQPELDINLNLHKIQLSNTFTVKWIRAVSNRIYSFVVQAIKLEKIYNFCELLSTHRVSKPPTIEF